MQIILCTYCPEEEGPEAFAWLNGGKGGGGSDRKGWCRGQGGGQGVIGLGGLSIEVRSGGVEAGS